MPSKAPAAPVNIKALLRGLLPSFLLAALVTAVVAKHLDWVWRSVAVTSALGAASLIWPWLKDGLAKQVSAAIHGFLTRRSVARALWTSTALVGAASLLMSSVHINATNQTDPIWLYRMEEALAGHDAPQKVDSLEFDRVAQHGGFLMMAPLNRRVWFLSSTYLRTPVLPLRPWSSPLLAFPERFDTVLTVALLPSPLLKGFVGDGRVMRILVRDDSGHLIAEDSITDKEGRSMLLSVVPAPPPDEALRKRWTGHLLKQARTADDSSRAMAFEDWTRHRWIRSRESFDTAAQLFVQMVASTGDTVIRQGFTVRRGYTDVILTQRRP